MEQNRQKYQKYRSIRSVYLYKGSRRDGNTGLPLNLKEKGFLKGSFLEEKKVKKTNISQSQD